MTDKKQSSIAFEENATPEIGKHIRLSSIEVNELFAEGILTLLIMFMMNITLIMLLSLRLNGSTEWVAVVFMIKSWFSAKLDFSHSWQIPWLLLMLLTDISAIVWRVRRRYRQLQFRHIIQELHYISKGHFDHRIPFKIAGDLGDTISGINMLVETAVKATEDLQRIEQSKDELIANVSHDIRTPLTSIIGYLAFIEENERISPEECENYVHTAYVKAHEMKVLLDDLFAYMRMQQPSVHLKWEMFDLVALLEQLSVDFSLESHKLGIEIIVTSEEAHVLMSGDAEKLVQVFSNLFSNAFKYGQGATTLEILVSRVEEKNAVQVIVQNNGEKIPSESLAHLFERFYRVDESRNTVIGGAGLGLAIAQTIIELHHGNIRATSDASWTRFIILLPITKRSATEMERA